MTAPDPALATALDNLTVQVNEDNVLAVHKVFRDHAEALESELRSLALNTTIGFCGGDPVSASAASDSSFGGKVKQLLAVHQAHQRELVVAADHLRQIALRYGHTEAEIERSLRSGSR